MLIAIIRKIVVQDKLALIRRELVLAHMGRIEEIIKVEGIITLAVTEAEAKAGERVTTLSYNVKFVIALVT